jgi:RNase P subunit RPR2
MCFYPWVVDSKTWECLFCGHIERIDSKEEKEEIEDGM